MKPSHWLGHCTQALPSMLMFYYQTGKRTEVSKLHIHQ